MVQRARPRGGSGPRRVSRSGPLRVLPDDRRDALARFRTVPDQPTTLPYVKDHVALRVVAGSRRRLDVEVRPTDLRTPRRSDTAISCAASGAASLPFRAEHGLGVGSTSARTCTSSSAGSRPLSRSRSRGTTSCSTSRSRSSPASTALLADWGTLERRIAGTRHGVGAGARPGWAGGRGADHATYCPTADRRDVRLRRHRCAVAPGRQAAASPGRDRTDHRRARNRSGPGHARASPTVP